MKYLVRILILLSIIPAFILWIFGALITLPITGLIQYPYHFVIHGGFPYNYETLTMKYAEFTDKILNVIQNYGEKKGWY